ncbi:VanZ family protein [Phyllobacterium sp. 21LDTY02-6]|uniref:VanZ family protein n=1 Tax=Phyllobacterium sp. 21LDTY02-6 TaxID=2944903 RepID=UPI00201FC3CE|nr:VanZ family protein [Phyllobacterium sp. 21LDTY02-6]MCO4319265.1 VanZ family protein [Phyllobacterium sp. 21LDTY02-6]
MLATIGPMSVRPVTLLGPNTERFAAFLALGIVFSLSYPNRLVYVGMVLFLCCGLFELGQYLMPGRHADISNFLVKMAGAGMGIAVMALFRDRIAARQPPN